MYFFINKRIILEEIRSKGILGLSSFILNLFKKIFYIIYLRFDLKTIRKNYTSESLVDYVFLKCEGILRPLQIRYEILKLLQILKQRSPKIIIEIGTARGGTLFLFTKVASIDALLISIDLPGGPSGQGYPKVKIPLYKSFALPTQNLILIRANSHDFAILNKVKAILKGRKVDFLFLDGDHTYQGVKRDFEMYSPLVQKDGIIGFHDIHLPISPNSTLGVFKLWNKIKKDYNYEEIVQDWNEKHIGIGILKEKKET